MIMADVSNYKGIVSISYKSFINNDVDFNENFKKALKEGFFYIEIPENFKNLAASLFDYIKTLHSTRNEEETKTLKHIVSGEEFRGFHHVGSQATACYFTKKRWKESLPKHVKDFAFKVDEITIEILRRSLKIVGIPEKLWNQATGGLLEENVGGAHLLSLMYYTPQKVKLGEIGLPEHRDSGWVTTLVTNQPGLEAKVNGKWRGISPKEGYLTINFGRSLETLVNDISKLNAGWHRVRNLDNEKITLVLFTDNRDDLPIYQFNNRLGSIEKIFNSQTELNNANFGLDNSE